MRLAQQKCRNIFTPLSMRVISSRDDIIFHLFTTEDIEKNRGLPGLILFE